MSQKVFFLVFIFLISCTENTNEIPVGVLPRDSMVNIMAEIHIAEAVLMNSGTPSFQKDIRSAYMQKVFIKANIDTTRFLKSFDYYSSHPELFAEMYEDVVTEISKRQAERNEK